MKINLALGGSNKMKNITVLGSGSWGTALSWLLHKNSHKVILWSFSKEEAENIIKERENKAFLPDVVLSEDIQITSDIQQSVHGAEIIVLAVPSRFVRETIKKFAPFLKKEQIIVNVSKGFDEEKLMRLSEVISEEAPLCKVAVLSGPSHAEEVSRGIPTTCVASSLDIEVAKQVQDIFMNDVFRVYTNTDLIGVELGGALKNVIALAAGISDGLGFGDNTKAALMTRGMAEMVRLGVAMGADPLTFGGLAGVGDLIVTCTSMHSRNRRAGILIGKGKGLEETLSEIKMVVEGVNTAKAAYLLSLKYGVEMPITSEINKALYQGKNPKDAVYYLMTRDKTDEIEKYIY